MKGKARWFNNGAGWGRALEEVGEDGRDHHVHFAEIKTHGCGFRTLAPDEEVEFESVAGSVKGRIPEAKNVKRSLPLQAISESAPKERFDEPPWAIEVEIAKNGEVAFPQLNNYHPRDHLETHVLARYLGQPGSFEQHNDFSVTMPLDEVNDDPDGEVAIYAVTTEGGVIKDRTRPGFRPGYYMAVIRLVESNKVSVAVHKISLRLQDSRHVEHPNDKGVWLVLETMYKDTLEIPSYEAGLKAEKELKAKLEAVIPAEFYHPSADHRKFAKVIARGIIAIRYFRGE